MRRSFWCRSLIALWGLWLGVVLTEPIAMHSCPMHGDHVMPMAGMPGMAADMANMATDMASAGQTADHGTPAHSSHTHCCTCLGACCCGTPVVAPQSPVAELAVHDVEVDVAIVPAPAAPAAGRVPPHSLPFANGPPAALSPRSL